MSHIAWVFRWACYRWYLAAPITWRLSRAALPYAGDYAYQSFEEFCERRQAAKVGK